MIRKVTLLLTLALLPSSFGAKYHNKPRIRREWRTLTERQRNAIAEAMWIIKTTKTTEGRASYGSHFINHDELVLMHACSIKDPRCDQGHLSPSFMSFHRAFLLAWENSVLSVLHSMDDVSIDAMPYWNVAYDSIHGKYRNDPENYIFTDKFFGDFVGSPEYDYAVTNGLFAYWPIAVHDGNEGHFGAESPLNHIQCIRENWCKGTKATVCDECCGRPASECDCSSGTFRYFLRGDDDLIFNRKSDHCIPYMRRNTWETPPPNGLHDLQDTEQDYDACRDPHNIKSWMDWQNCIDFGQPSCLLMVSGIGNLCADRMNELIQKIEVTSILSFARKMMLRTRIPFLCKVCTFSGSYDKPGGRKGKTNALHSIAHMAIGGDMADVLTSPNDPAVFFGYHGNIDRNNMDWMISSPELEDDYWHYPKSNRDFDLKDIFSLSGPWPLYPAVACTLEPKAYDDFVPFSSPWLAGTTLDEVVNSGFPLDNLFDAPPANGWGYTHREILYHTSPQRTPYTYDTLAHYYYDNDGHDDYNYDDDYGYRTRRTTEIEPLEADN